LKLKGDKMIAGDYEKILKVISRNSNLDISELEERVEEKRKKLAGLISKEGAAQVIAAELGISFDEEKMKIEELSQNMRSVNMVGKVINISPIRTFVRNGKEGKVVNLTVADDTSNIRVVLWDMHHISLIEKDEIKNGTSVEINNGSMRNGEVHLGSFSEIKVSDELFDKVITERVAKEKSISNFNENENVSVRAFIVQTFPAKFFNVCPECSKKVDFEDNNFICKEHGKVAPEKRAILNLVVDDGTETIRVVAFHENIEKLGLPLEEERLSIEKQSLLGKERIFVGNVRNNSYFNNLELILNSSKEVDLDKLINELEK
jgi:ssDNA-binding replication factor A large subunit